jgi:hypothetical protein
MNFFFFYTIKHITIQVSIRSLSVGGPDEVRRCQARLSRSPGAQCRHPRHQSEDHLVEGICFEITFLTNIASLS